MEGKAESKTEPDYRQSVRSKYVKLGYHYLLSNLLYVVVAPALATLWAYLSTSDLQSHWAQLVQPNLLAFTFAVALLALLLVFFLTTRPRSVYLVDFACFKPDDDDGKTTPEVFLKKAALSGAFNQQSLDLQRKILERSGIGKNTYLPRAILSVPPSPSVAEARLEAEMLMFGTVDQLLAKTQLNPKDIGIVIVNCIVFNPTPSLSSMLVNHYKLKGNIQSYSLGGMGCSAGLISVDLARQLLQVHPNTYALVVSMESATLSGYWGNEKSMLVTNCLFRMGAAAVLLSNRRSDRRRSKYQLVHSIRTHKGADDRSYGCIFQREDDQGKLGVSLSKDLMSVAGDALKTNITTLGPLVLPLSEQLLFLATLIGRSVLKMKGLKPYVPDFKLAFEHFCVHAGGRAVLDEVEKNLELSEWHMEPSRMTLYRFGNTSSSSVLYELAYTEAKGRVRRGDRLWMIGFGSGFKCTSAVWRALRTVDPAKEKNPWMDEIRNFPVHVPKVADLKF